jgi:hypothetical protein
MAAMFTSLLGCGLAAQGLTGAKVGAASRRKTTFGRFSFYCIFVV